jgi:hypothetical protein
MLTWDSLLVTLSVQFGLEAQMLVTGVTTSAEFEEEEAGQAKALYIDVYKSGCFRLPES